MGKTCKDCEETVIFEWEQPQNVEKKEKEAGSKKQSSKNKRKERRTKERGEGKSSAGKIKFEVKTTPICGGVKKERSRLEPVERSLMSE